MYPNSALSAGQLTLIAVVAVLCLAIWLGAVFVAAREPRHREAGAATASRRSRSADMEGARAQGRLIAGSRPAGGVVAMAARRA